MVQLLEKNPTMKGLRTILTPKVTIAKLTSEPDHKYNIYGNTFSAVKFVSINLTTLK